MIHLQASDTDINVVLPRRPALGLRGSHYPSSTARNGPHGGGCHPVCPS